ncbi:MAG: hypothetical protein LBU61_05370 [Coriobacteriales bacterium]|nr:hypothetical protein [Coriobacteriales bacterium]
MDRKNKYSQVMLVPTRVLLLLAAVVWFLAGGSVAMVGIKAAPHAWDWQMLILLFVVFGFFFLLFIRLTHRNTRRILSITDELRFILQFFDASSYIVMAVMVFIGASLRISTFLPNWIIAFFYSGLGAALIFSSCYLVISYIKTWDNPHFRTER